MDGSVDHAVGVILHKKVETILFEFDEHRHAIARGRRIRLQDAASLIRPQMLSASRRASAPQPLLVGERIAARLPAVATSIASVKVRWDTQVDLCRKVGIAVLGFVFTTPAMSPPKLTTKPGTQQPQGGPRYRQSRNEVERPAYACFKISGRCQARRSRCGYTKRLPCGPWSWDITVPESDRPAGHRRSGIRGFFGMLTFLGVMTFLSDNRQAISALESSLWGAGLLQWAFAVVVLRVPAAGIRFLKGAGEVVKSILDCAH